MHDERTQGEQLVAHILKRDPAFGSNGYQLGRALLAKMHAPNAPGPGPAQRPTKAIER